MLPIEETNSFRKDLKRSKKRGKDIAKLLAIVEQLALGKTLAAKYRPHPLRGEWVPSWECHIEPDWLLVYQLESTRIILVRTGTHSDLFP